MRRKFSRIRILKKVDSIEDSKACYPPANPLTGATAVKSETKTESTVEAKGIFEDVIEEREESLYFLTDQLTTAIYRAQMIDEYAEQAGTTFDIAAAIDLILSEFSARVRASVLEDDQEEDTGVDDGNEGMNMASFRGPISFKGDLRERLPFAKHAEAALGAVEVFAKRGAALAEILTELTGRSKAIMERREVKAGAVYSGSNLSHMQRIHDAIGKVKKRDWRGTCRYGRLIAKAKPAKADDQELDAQALRTRSLKAQSIAMRALN